jgi:predicted O-methyltransferase YrrM
MNALLEEIFKTKKFTNSRNEVIGVHSETSKGQCEFLQQLIRDNNFSQSIEIGFAFGMSTLAIVEEVVKRGGHHAVIDKFQVVDWAGLGLDLIKQAGYEKDITFYEDYCYAVLPGLLASGKKFDFAYIDSTKQFDWLMVDFFYIEKMLKVGGIIVFDDVPFPSIRKLMRYIVQFPSYRVHSQFPENYPTSAGLKIAGAFKALPKADKLIRPEILVTDHEMGLNTGCLAIQKVDEDKRSWDWHVEF